MLQVLGTAYILSQSACRLHLFRNYTKLWFPASPLMAVDVVRLCRIEARRVASEIVVLARYWSLSSSASGSGMGRWCQRHLSAYLQSGLARCYGSSRRRAAGGQGTVVVGCEWPSCLSCCCPVAGRAELAGVDTSTVYGSSVPEQSSDILGCPATDTSFDTNAIKSA